ncbi:hypothetical protein L1987_81957 [Smallanthus sonchifolius]|uniref:Uncharacterized protein n=1 Tax=Smallanthus sonchifolius TaxID=185202 RepID=A0ACB8YSL8_9ASTR|nr:hypothetical protein L1987_81957 [Smallanthus sonchifolius]
MKKIIPVKQYVSVKEHDVYLARDDDHSDRLLCDQILQCSDIILEETDGSNANSISCDTENSSDLFRVCFIDEEWLEDICPDFEKSDVLIVDGSDHSSVIEKGRLLWDSEEKLMVVYEEIDHHEELNVSVQLGTIEVDGSGI